MYNDHPWDHKVLNLNFLKKMAKNGRCGQVLMTFWTRFRWSLIIVDRWSLFRDIFSTRFAREGFRVVVVVRRSLAEV